LHMSDTTPTQSRDTGAPLAAPPAQGLYHPAHEHDACGIGMVANSKGVKSHAIIEEGLQILVNRTHRGAVGADPLAGDGAGILVGIPHEFLSAEAERLGFTLPQPGDYGVGYLFMPRGEEDRARCRAIIEQVLRDEGLPLLGWRDVPVNNKGLPESVLASEPFHSQLFVGR